MIFSACAYPNITALAELLATPQLRALPFTGTRRDQVRFEVRLHVAVKYQDILHDLDVSTLRDPLLLWIEQERSRRRVDADPGL